MILIINLNYICSISATLVDAYTAHIKEPVSSLKMTNS